MSSPPPRLARQDRTQWRVLSLVATCSGNIPKYTPLVSEKSKNRKCPYILNQLWQVWAPPMAQFVCVDLGPGRLAARHHGLQPNEIKSKKARSKASSSFHCDCWASPGPNQHSCAVFHPQLFKREGRKKFSKSSRIQLVWYWCLFG